MRLLRRLWYLLRQRQFEADLAEEMQFHRDRAAEDLRANGVDPHEAVFASKRSFGNGALIQDQSRDVWLSRWLQEGWRDVRFAARALRKNPTFAFVSVVTLALGIGANTFVFTVINSLLLAPLTVERPEEIVFIQGGAADGIGHSFPNYLDIRDRNTTFTGVIGYRIAPMNVEWSAGPRRAWGFLATDNYFTVLGVTPALGRFFDAGSDAAVTVLSFETWRAHFANDPNVIGRTIRINKQPFTVIGVAPANFRGIERVFDSELWVPMLSQPLIEPGHSWLESRRSFNVWLAARTKPHVPPDIVRADLGGIADYLARTYPEANEGLKLTSAKPGLVGDAFRTPLQAFTWATLALATLVLLTACANLSSVLAARTADRQREIAVRVSLGASRRHIIRQVLTESALLSAFGGLAGAVLAVIGARALSQWRFVTDLPMKVTIEPDVQVFLVAFGLATVAGLLFGVAPAWQSTRTDPNVVLKGQTAHSGARRWALRDALLVVQVAISIVLLTACFLSVRGLRQALTMPIGFEPMGLTMAGSDLGLAGYTARAGGALQTAILDDVRRLPGVERAASASSIPLFPDHSTSGVFADGQPLDEPAHFAEHYSVSTDFFTTMGMPFRAGRDFDARDHGDAALVAIVNETFAHHVFGSVDAVGRRFRYTRSGPSIEIVGIVGDGKYQTLTEPARAALFEPITQSPNLTTILIARSALPSDVMSSAFRATFADHDAGLSLYNVGSVADAIGITLLPNQVAAWALSSFGVLAALLAATGIHGMVAYGLARRRREIGIHVALGAYPTDVLRLVLGRTARVLVVGTVAGLLLAAVIGPILGSVVYLTSPRDPWLLLSAPVALGIVGALACLRPALAAMRVAPIVALRAD